MILCSCSVLSEKEIREYLEKTNPEYIPTVKKVLEDLGYTVECATCSKTIKDVIRNHCNGESNGSAIRESCQVCDNKCVG